MQTLFGSNSGECSSCAHRVASNSPSAVQIGKLALAASDKDNLHSISAHNMFAVRCLIVCPSSCRCAQVQGMTGSKLYGSRSGADYTDNQKRFKLFSQAALEALTCLPFSPGENAAVVCNDWHTALLPVILKVAA